jgi:predicted nuclease of predicted toxin-antitoxin system
MMLCALLGMAQASDEENLNKAIELNRIFVTRDKDYGNLVFVKEIRTGVLYLRVLPSDIALVHAELERILNEYHEEDLNSAFVVVEAGRHRFRKID